MEKSDAVSCCISQSGPWMQEFPERHQETACGSGSWRTRTFSTVLLLLREHPLSKQCARPHAYTERVGVYLQRIERLHSVCGQLKKNRCVDWFRVGGKTITFLILLPLVEHLDPHHRIFFPCVFFHQGDQEGCKAQYRKEKNTVVTYVSILCSGFFPI